MTPFTVPRTDAQDLTARILIGAVIHGNNL